MEDIHSIATRAFVEDLATSGSTHLVGDLVRYEPLGLDLQLEVVNHRDGEAFVQVGLRVSATGADLDGRQVTVHCIGTGEDLAAACQQAAMQWACGVLPVFHRALADHPMDEPAPTGTMVTLDSDGRARGWRVHLGQIIARVVGPDGAAGTDRDPAQFVSQLMNELAGVDTRGGWFWLELFAARSATGEVSADCRIRNGLWEAGTRVLANFASTWTECPESFVTRRQFVLCQPAALDEVDPTGEARRDLEARASRGARSTRTGPSHAAPSWLDRLRGRR